MGKLFFILLISHTLVRAENSGFCIYTLRNGVIVPVKACTEPNHVLIMAEMRARIRAREDRDKTPVVQTTSPTSHVALSTLKLETTTDTPTTPTAPRATHLLLGRRRSLGLVSMTASSVLGYVIYPVNITNLVAVDYDPVEKHVYWTGNTFILRANATDTEGQMIVSNLSTECDGIAVDWVARNLYWSDKIRSVIEVSRLNGDSRKALITSDIQFPRSIALDPAAGNMYWSDWGSVPKIETASLNGEDRRVVVNESLMWPNGIALDYTRRVLYWADAGLDRIEEIGIDGRGRKLLFQAQQHIFGFTYLYNFLYWTDWQNETLDRMFVPFGIHQNIASGVSDLMGIKAYGDAPFNHTNDCVVNNGGCSHLCLYTPNGPTCHCPNNYIMTSDTKTCVRAF